VPPLFSILSGDGSRPGGEFGFAVVVPDFTSISARRAARTVWDAHVGGSPFASVTEFQQLIKAGQEMTWFQYSQADPEAWGERWGERGDLLDNPIQVFWFLDDDIPGRFAWD
jgi:hypothetical protein